MRFSIAGAKVLQIFYIRKRNLTFFSFLLPGIHNFPQWNHNKVTSCHQRMGYLEFGQADVLVTIEKNIDVDNAVVVQTIFAFASSSHRALNQLSGVE